MINIIGKIGTGKTTKLIQLAKDNNGTIITLRPEYIINKMYRLGITGVDVKPYRALFESEIDKNTPIYLDRLDKYFTHLGYDVEGYTCTNDIE